MVVTCNFMLTLVRQRALQSSVLSLHYNSFAYSLPWLDALGSFLNVKRCINNYNYYGKQQKFVWFCYLVVFVRTLLFCKRLPVLSVFCFYK